MFGFVGVCAKWAGTNQHWLCDSRYIFCTDKALSGKERDNVHHHAFFPHYIHHCWIYDTCTCSQSLEAKKKIAVASVTVWHSIFAFASCSLRSRAFCDSCSRKVLKNLFLVCLNSKCSETHRNKKNTPLTQYTPRRSDIAQLNINTINQTKVPTFSPSLIKIWPIVSEI